MKNQSITEAMLQFIEESPTAFHAAANVEALLLENGFEKLENLEEGALVPGGSYYTMQNGSAVLAVKISENPAKGFRIAASHSDSPCFKIKEVPEMKVENTYVKLNVEKYGGMILSPWLDRPLSVAGRVFVAGKDGKPEAKLVNLKKDLLIIPNVAIHFNREINNGFAYNPQTDMAPLMGLDQELSIKKLCAEAAGVAEEEILGSDLYVYNRDKGRIMGADDSLIGSPRLDDLQCAYATLHGFLASKPEEFISVYALFDNEEVGSGTKQGADSTFLTDTVRRIASALNIPEAEWLRKMPDSFMLSADNAHAVHPNYTEKCDQTNRCYLNGGIVIKYSANQKYTTDSVSAAVFGEICRKAEVPVMIFHNRSDMAGGSTLGNISNGHLSLNTVDIGIPQLAMHSCVETAGEKDTAYMVKAMTAFYNADIRQTADGMYTF